jgi:malonyl-CoA O-methyltransferase
VRQAAVPEKRAARRAFDRAAKTYDAHAVLHREVGARLVEHLDPIRIDPHRIVDLGCGTGHGFDALRTRYPRAQIIGVDFSRSMLREARGRSSWLARALGTSSPRLVCADAEALPLAAASVDMVISNLALQWTRAEVVFGEAARVLPVGGLCMFSTFGPDTLKELRGAFAALDAAPHVNAFVDMHDLGDALVHVGFAEPVMEMEVLTLEYSALADLARDLKETGAHNVLPERARGLMTPRRWRRVIEAYEGMRRDGVLPATFEIVYGHAWKAEARLDPGAPQPITFQRRMR